MAPPPYPHLFSPLRIGRTLMLKNRLALSPHTTGFAEPGGRLGGRDADYQEARARGGVGLTVLGTSVVHASSPRDNGVLANLDDSYVPGYRLVADAVHRHGAALFAQLNHQGLAAHGGGAGRPLLGPSPVASFIHGETPQVMDPPLIREIVQAFGAAAARCQTAGVDGVLVHAAHGYLINQFLSPLTNRRTDAYGGSLEGRLRLLLEVLAAIRQAVGTAYPVGVRISADEYLPGGLGLDDSRAIARRLDQSGMVDYLDVSSGVDYDWLSRGRHYPAMFWPAETWIELAAAIRAIVDVPVACAGRIRGPAEAERLLAEGKIDLAQMARPLIVDPELPRKAQEGRAEAIRPCLYVSSGCLGRLYRGLPISCVQNPTVGHERELGDLPPAARPRRIVVVGGGPAGLEAALIARRRGHAVVLLERAAQLGGQMRVAAAAPGRAELRLGLVYLERALAEAGVELRLGVTANRSGVVAERPDAVVVATGSEPAPLDGLPPSASVVAARDVLDGWAAPGPRVVVVDGLGRMAAASAADHLAQRGHEVILVARDYAPGSNIDHTTRPAVARRLREAGVRELTGAEVVGFQDGSVRLRDCFTGRTTTLDGVDAVVHDVGGRPRDTLYHELASASLELHRVGDCLAPRGFEEASHEGFRVGLTL